MNVKVITVVDEIEIQYNKRSISYFNDCYYSYWYNGKQKCYKQYPEHKWKKLLNKYNGGFLCDIKYNQDYDYRQAEIFYDCFNKKINEVEDEKNM
jgi:hypothetical protein